MQYDSESNGLGQQGRPQDCYSRRARPLAALPRPAKLVAAALCAVSLACAHGQVDRSALTSTSDRVVWEAGMKALQKKQYPVAREHFRRIVDAFPQSERVPDARLMLGEAHYQEADAGSYILAVAEYREFLSLYPSHPRADYAQFMAGESYFKRKNSSDRDQTTTHQALEEYQRLLDVYPESSHIEAARERIRATRQTLGKHEFQVGYFYQKTRKAYRSAALRYQGLLDDYPDYDRIDEVLFRLGEVLVASGRGIEALPYLDRLASEFPSSPFVEPARAMISAVTLPKPAGSPGAEAPRSPAPTAPAKP